MINAQGSCGRPPSRRLHSLVAHNQNCQILKFNFDNRSVIKSQDLSDDIFSIGVWQLEHLIRGNLYLEGTVTDLESRLKSRHSVAQLEWKKPMPWHQARAQANQPPATLNQFHSVFLLKLQDYLSYATFHSMSSGCRTHPSRII